MTEELTMYMVTHKHVDYIPKGRTPVFVGNGDNPDKFLRDNTGINISEKNPYYCELTALYWIWKNDHHSKYVSIEHYRRFFMKRNTVFPSPYSKERMLKDIKEYQAVLIRAGENTLNIGEYYCKIHDKGDYQQMYLAIKRLYPDYLPYFNKLMSGNRCSLFNMCVLDKLNFDSYCSWLFSVLAEVEKNITLVGRSKYQQRAFGFMAERLLNVWIMRNIESIKYMNVYYYEKNKIYSALKSLKHEIPGKYDPVKLG